MKRNTILSVVLLIFSLSTNAFGQSAKDDIPTFEIVGICNKFYFSIVVPKGTSQQQMINLIYEFKKARDENYLSKYFPPTTPGSSRGDYAVIYIYVFSDKNNASNTLLGKYIVGSAYGETEKKFEQEYAENVSAFYMYNFVDNKEFGCLGLRDIDVNPTKKYKKLFARNVPY